MIADLSDSAIAWQLVKVPWQMVKLPWLAAAWTCAVRTGRKAAVRSTTITPHPELT